MRIHIPDKQELRQRLSYVVRASRLVFEASGRWTIGWFLLLVVQGLLPAATVYLTKWVVDSVNAVVGVNAATNGGITWESIQLVLVPASLMAGVMLLSRVLSSVNQWISTAQGELVQDHMKGIIHEKAAEVDYELYESAEYYDRLSQANSEAGSRSLALLRNAAGIVQSSITLFAIAGLLITYSVFLPLVLIGSTLPALYVVIWYNHKYHNWWRQTTHDRRRTQYYDMLLTHQGSAAEVRIFGLGPFFTSSYQKIRKRLREGRLRLLREQAMAKLGASGMALVTIGVVLSWMLVRAMNGRATLGDLALFYQAFKQGQGLTRTLLNSAGQIYTNTLFLEHLFEFLEIETKKPQKAHPVSFPIPLREEIRFENITFRYPRTEKNALANFNLTIPAGQNVAIVGANGAGKSTLVKLLCRFYDPNDGRITVDGAAIQDMHTKELRRQIAVMFQAPTNYQTKANNSIAMADLERDHEPASVEAAARSASAHEFITKLPQSYDTLLGRWFEGGMELSGGEWQRIALARAFFRRAQIVVLDEPTSHMDSWAEHDWFQRFKEEIADRTSITITHRFTTAMQADVIHVMEKGSIVESGSHQELVEQGGRYAESWAAQRQQSDGLLAWE